MSVLRIIAKSILARDNLRNVVSNNNMGFMAQSQRHNHVITRAYIQLLMINNRVNGLGQKYSKRSQNFSFQAKFSLSTKLYSKPKVVLGIETSCDDTGAAIVDENGNIIGEALHSQIATHNEVGGIIPNVAKELHAQNVESIVQRTLDCANMQLQDLDAIAVTVKPGLVMSLRVGLRHAQKLAHLTNQQLIPIHHMEAHALTARMINRVDFPFLVLLASGGHCLLAVARDIDDFLLLGYSLDIAPGEAYDKTARELKLNVLPEFSNMSGGAAIELLARDGDPTAFPRVHVMPKLANCCFSFTGLKMSARIKIKAEYDRLGLPVNEILPNVADICAWFQSNIMYHLARRLQRAFAFAEGTELLGANKTLVVSGGVASNLHIRANLQHMCNLYNYRLICPPQKLCTDNGIMIAWNGMEKILSGRNYFQNVDSVDVQANSPLGVDISKKVSNCSIRLPKLKLLGY